jgi:hypothetical protein
LFSPRGFRAGQLLLERDEIAVGDFVRRACWEAEDDEQRNRMILLAQTAGTSGATP